jgi:acyl-CoA thioesterase I
MQLQVVMMEAVRHLIRVGALALPIIASSGCESPTATSDGERTVRAFTIVALGDSLTAGPGLTSAQAWPSLLQERMRREGYPHRMVNAGISGDTTAGALRRLDAALTPDTGLLIVALGANDGLRGVPVEEVRRNLSAIIERAQARNIRVLLCGMQTLPTRGWDYTLAFQRIFPDLAQQYNVPLMPFLLAGVVGNPELNLGDGIHPNAAGMQRIADAMWPYLEPLLR